MSSEAVQNEGLSDQPDLPLPESRIPTWLVLGFMSWQAAPGTRCSRACSGSGRPNGGGARGLSQRGVIDHLYGGVVTEPKDLEDWADYSRRIDDHDLAASVS